MDYITAQQAGVKWSISKRRVLVLCTQNRIVGTVKIGHQWLIPNSAEKPDDFRKNKKLRHID